MDPGQDARPLMSRAPAMTARVEVAPAIVPAMIALVVVTGVAQGAGADARVAEIVVPAAGRVVPLDDPNMIIEGLLATLHLNPATAMKECSP